jgi:glycosyltransferase involved in cell wall biosynthesis
VSREPLVSVVIPAYNAEAFIGATLDSALQQTHRAIEVIVVDDGSSDGTAALVEAYARRDSRVRLVRQQNAGVAAARNRGIADARGDFVAPLDADDLWEPTKIERQVARMLEAGSDVGIVYCWWLLIDRDGAILDSSPQWQVEGRAVDALLQVNFAGNASVPLFRRQALVEVGGYDASLRARGAQGFEDWDVALKVAEQWNVAVVPAVLVGYRRQDSGMSASTDRMWRSYELVIQGVRARRPDVNRRLLRRSRHQFALYVAGIAFWSRKYGRASTWILRAMWSRATLQTLPHLLWMLVRRPLSRRRSARPIVEPGARFATWLLEPTLIPYDRIYRRRFARLRLE